MYLFKRLRYASNLVEKEISLFAQTIWLRHGYRIHTMFAKQQSMRLVNKTKRVVRSIDCPASFVHTKWSFLGKLLIVHKI